MAKKTQYYSLEKIDSKNCIYNVIFGERSNGKTFAVQEKGFCNFVHHGKQMALIRRFAEDYTGKRGSATFEALVNAGVVARETNGEWTDIFYQSSRWYLAKWDEKLNKRIVMDKPFCYAFSLSAGEHDKSTSYPDVTTILFDEFLTRRFYIPNEFVEFMNILSTIIRQRDDVKIYMCGNTVNQFCPYFDEMGLTNILNMKKGDIDIYEYGQSELRVAVEYAEGFTKGKKSDKYFAFDNPKLSMITGGAWEIALYPHLPIKYKQQDIRFVYFIYFSKNLLQCEIVRKDGLDFTFIHRKTTDLKQVKRDLIYSTEYSGLPNWSRRITAPRNSKERKIYQYFKDEKIFYQDNTVGEVVRNYLIWSKTDGGIT